MKNILPVCAALLFCFQSFSQDNLKVEYIRFRHSGPPVYYDILKTINSTYYIDSLGLQTLRDDGKWRLYCMYCDSNVRWTRKPRKFGELELNIFRFEPFTGSLDFNQEYFFDYDFVYPDYPDTLLPMPSETICGIRYSKKQPQKPIYMVTYNGRRIDLELFKKHNKRDSSMRSKVRAIDPMQPEVISYIRENAAKLNPWFYAEANKRGVFDSTKYPPAKIQAELDYNIRHKQDYLHYSMFYHWDPVAQWPISEKELRAVKDKWPGK